MWKFYLAIALVWLALMPPFFTNGACNAEFAEASKKFQSSDRAFRTVDKAVAKLVAEGIAHQVVTAEGCRQVKPRFLEACPSGTLIRAEFPVKNPVCSIYRDANIRLTLQYHEKGWLEQLSADMKPDKYLWIPGLDLRLYWGR